MVVEDEVAGMVGLNTSFLFYGTRPMDSAERVFQCSSNLAIYSGVGCGMYRCSPLIFQELEFLQKRMPFKDTMEDQLQSWASTGRLLFLSSRGRSWFCVESDQSAEYTQSSMVKIVESSDDVGLPIRLSGIPKKSQRATDGGDWAEFDVGKWRNAVFSAHSYHHNLYDDTTEFIIKCGNQIGGSEKALVIEVGSGTGEALIPLAEHFRYAVGVDFNPNFVEFSNSQVTEDLKSKVRFITGDACELGDLLAREAPEMSGKDVPKVVTCVGNTIGIMPDEIKKDVYMEAARVAGKNGIVVMVYWNGNKFGDAVQHFYHANPQLCGEFDGSAIDLSSCTLSCPSGYTTHWTRPEEARAIIEGYGLQVVSVEESPTDKVGVLAAFRLADSRD